MCLQKKTEFAIEQGVWVEPDKRDAIVDYVDFYSKKCGLAISWICAQLGLPRDKYYEWKARYGLPNQHNGQMPRQHWLTEDEKDAIVKFYIEHQNDGYRRCSYMMIDQDVAYASPSAVYRALKQREALRQRTIAPSSNGKGYIQPEKPHQEWHSDITAIRISNTFYFLIAVLDGYSRKIMGWSLREKMETSDVTITVEKALENLREQKGYENAKPKIISDNGSQYTSKEFKTYLGVHELGQALTSPYYPQSNGKQERFWKSLKHDCIRILVPLDKKEAVDMIEEYVHYYNNERLHSAIGYVAPNDMIHGKQEQIHQQRDEKLEAARKQRASVQLAQRNRSLSLDKDQMEGEVGGMRGSKK